MDSRLLLGRVEPDGLDTLAVYLERSGIATDSIEPLPVKLLIDYVDWFCQQNDLAPAEGLVTELRFGTRGLEAHLDNGSAIHARAVVAAPGFAPFAHRPPPQT